MKRLLLSTLILASMHSFAIDLTDIKQEKEYELYGASTNAQMEFNNAYKYRQFATYSGKYVVFQASHDNNYDERNKFGYYVKNTWDNSITRIPPPEGMNDDDSFNQMTLGYMTSNGRFIVMTNQEYRGRLVYLYDLKTGKSEIINKDQNGQLSDAVITGYNVAVSEDGKYVYYGYYGPALEHSTSNYYYVYLWDREKNTRTRINYDMNGETASYNISTYPRRQTSGDGRYFMFSSTAQITPEFSSGKNQVYIYDRITKTSHRLIAKDPTTNKELGIGFPSLSIDGKYATFIPSMTKVAWFDLTTSEIKYINQDSDGNNIGKQCHYPSISENGEAVGFECDGQAYFYDNTENKVRKASISMINGNDSPKPVKSPVVLGNGNGMMWQAQGGQMLPGDNTSYPRNQVYLFRQKPGTTESKICFSDEY